MLEKNAITFINLFFVPMISLAILRKKNLLSDNYFDIFKSYCILCVANLIFTRFFIFFARIILHSTIELFSIKYTLISSISAIIMSYIYFILKKYINVK